MTRKLIYFVLVVLALLAVPMAADLIINFTVMSITLDDVKELSVTKAETPGDLKAVLTYEMKTDTGTVYKPGSHGIILNPAQKTAMLNFINGTMIPAANIAEGLE